MPINQIDYQFYPTKIGELLLASYDDKLCMLDFKLRKARNTVNKRIAKGLNAQFIEQDNDILNETRIQLNEYLLGQRQSLNIPLLMVGTDFQKQVWRTLLKIPYGATISYLNLAENINHIKAVRAVANANAANAMAVVIPCHRVIATNGKLGGYAGGLNAKQFLLALEQT